MKGLPLKAKHTVGWIRYVEEADTDPYGEPVAGYLPPQPVKVYAVADTDPEELPGITSDRLSDRKSLYVPPEFPDVDRKDRMELRDGIYEVDGGVVRYDQGPFGYNPGGRLRLVKVEGGL